jgi:hypothetical protein
VSAEAFAASLAAIGLEAKVEAHGRVALLQVDTPLDRASRRKIIASGRAHGFTNVALELAPDANLSGD